MGLKVLAPWAHPVSGIYYFRKVVPQGLRSILGRSEEKHSLHTRDPYEARRRHRLVEAEVADKWAHAHVQTITPESAAGAVLTDMDAQALASEIYREVLCERQAGSSMPKVWERAVLELQQSLPVGKAVHSAKVIFGLPSAAVLRAQGAEIKAFLSRKGLDYDSFGQEKLAFATAQAIFRASKLIKRSAAGDHAAGPTPDPAPRLERAKRKFPKLSVDELMTGYAVEAKIAPTSEKRWRGVMNALAKFLKTDDLSSVTEADMIRWKEYRLAKNISPTTVRDADIAAPKAIFGWAFQNRKMAINPAKNVVVRVPTNKAKLRERSFSVEEAEKILSATLRGPSRNMTREGAAARRWIPWICAYHGARVNEITQLRPDDVFLLKTRGHPDVWVMRITPDAGTVKGGRARIVPIHPHLIEQGFLEFVASRKDKPLFYDPSRSRGGNAAHSQASKVGERLAVWVRSKDIGITDKDVQPNHAWRHRFRSVARSVGIAPDMINAIDGHAAASVADAYGDHWAWVMLEALSKIPSYHLA